MLLKQVADAFVASRQWDSASLSRLAFWVDMLGDREIIEVTIDDVDDALVRLAERGRLRGGRATFHTPRVRRLCLGEVHCNSRPWSNLEMWMVRSSRRHDRRNLR